MATEPERLTRGSATQLDALQVLLVRNEAVIHTLSVGVQDPSSPMVRAFMQIADTIGGLEVAIKTQRQNARNQDELAVGRALWGQRRFGFVAAQLALNVGDTIAPMFFGPAQTLNINQRAMSIRYIAPA
jgi:DNA invertase Pin-like site-specific DNA recombinase